MIPLFKPSVSEKEISNVTEVLKSGWWGMGPKVAEFEEKFAKKMGVKYAVAVNSATEALHLACVAHGIGEGDEVIVPALTFVSTALAPLYCGAEIVFADINEDTLCIDWWDVEKKITKKTKAIIPVHYSGKNALSGYKSAVQAKYPDIVIIEDCAHAAGSRFVGANTSCWSFHAVKNLATGDGGMVTTNDGQIYRKLLALRWCGIDKSTWERAQKKYGWDYSIESVGYKAHMNDLTAALGLAQLERLDDLNMKRNIRVLEYLDRLRDIPFLELPEYDSNSSWHLFAVKVDSKDRDRFIDFMLENGISAGVHYKPLNTYPIFPETELPVTDRVWKMLVTLPLFPDMTHEELNYIIETIGRFK